MTWRRGIQVVILLLFCLMVALAEFPLAAWLPLHSFMQMDPLIFLGTFLSAGILVPGLLFALLVLGATLLLGRFFCGYICPMGTTFDLTLPMVRAGKKGPFRALSPSWRSGKYLFLVLIGVSAVLGLNLLHWGSPLVLASRLYALVLAPLADFLLQASGKFLNQAAQLFNLNLVPGGGEPSRYHTLFFMAAFFSGLILINRWAARFWCRYLCPSGAILALAARRPLFRRSVSSACNDCGKCQKSCPMQAIPEDPRQTRHEECVVCMTCVRICPEGAVAFTARGAGPSPAAVWPARRRVIEMAGLAFLFAFLGHRGLYEYRPEGSGKGLITPAGLIRPPGAVPEVSFLSLCTRCGLCMKVCPTNMLQPAWLEAGFSGMFSPLAVAKRGPCEASCNACGWICPTEAIRPLSLYEKMWARMGTAVINRDSCLPWAYDRTCQLCDEACPYGAIEMERRPEHKEPVPVLLRERCTGCGFCENACPVRAEAAIVVTPMWELRLSEGSYVREGRRLGFSVSRIKAAPEKEGAEEKIQGLPPGFTE